MAKRRGRHSYPTTGLGLLLILALWWVLVYTTMGAVFWAAVKLKWLHLH